jgi:hypothetical protein
LHLFLRLVVGAVLVTGRRLVQIRQQAAGLVAAAGRMSILLVPLVTHHLEVHHKETLVETVLATKGGGGGGAGAAGGDGTSPGATGTGNGGNGVQDSITGVSPAPYYGGGGGGGAGTGPTVTSGMTGGLKVEDKVSAEIVLLGQMELVLGAVEAVLVAVRLTVALQEQVSTAALA